MAASSTCTTKLVSFNARSIASKQAELSSFINFHNCDIVAITETWLSDNINFNSFNSNYNIFRQDRVNGRGGGVLLGIKNCFQYKFVEAFSIDNCECVFVDILIDSSTYMRYGAIYRPPDTSNETSMLLFNQM